MADYNINFVTNNVFAESDKVIKFINPFTNHQQHQIEDFSLFLSVSEKCRCCFNKLINESDQHKVESWHRQAFLALTGVEMITPDSENFLCLKCSEILKIFIELGKTAANLQRKYNFLMQDLASDIKTEKDETDEVSGRLQDYSDIVISDNESASENKQPQQKNSSDIMQSGTIYDGDITIVAEDMQTVEKSAIVNKCTVRLTRIDHEIIDNYEYYSIDGYTEDQKIDQTSQSSGISKTKSHKDSETNANLKITDKMPNNTKCNICGKTLKTKKNLKIHIKIHNNRPRLSCDLCEKSLACKQSIRQHMHTYHMNVKFSCHLCPAVFESSAKLRHHKQIVHCKFFKCEDCGAAFGKASLLAEHVKAMHDGKRWYCHYQDCSSSFPVRYNAILHLKYLHSLKDEHIINDYLKTENNDQSIIKCHICGKARKNLESLKIHIKDYHNTTRVSCDLCGKTFIRKQVIRQHMREMHMNIKFKCHLCPAEFESSAKLLNHKQLLHRKNFECEECDAAFGKPRLLSEHIKAMHKLKRWYCHYRECSTSFSIRYYAIIHLKNVHSIRDINKFLKTEKNDQSNTKCQICGMIAKSRKALYAHFRKIHSNTTRFSCDLCGQTFSHKQKMDLIDHMYKHQKKIKFSCKLCPAEFQSNLTLISHEKNVHKKKFKCEKCDASFVEVGRLTEHVKVQHEGKRYNCQVPGCSRSYALIKSARGHLKYAHLLKGEEYRKYSTKLDPRVEPRKEVVVKCQICEKIFKKKQAMYQHVSRFHNKNKSCDFCGIKFSSKTYLTDHMHTFHMNVKFKCDLCSLDFRSERKLKGHKYAAHKKNLKCDQCDAAFGAPQVLKNHVKRKHEGKRYHCSYPGCSASFSTKPSVVNHLNVEHSLVGENFNRFHEKLVLQ